MKILIFSEYYFPERFLITEIAEALAKKGNEITVITGLPNYGFKDGKIPIEYRDHDREIETINGVKILRTKMVGRGKNKITLLLSYFSYCFGASHLIKKIEDDFDVVYLYQLTPILQAYPAIKYCKKNNKRLLCYCLDLAPASGIQLLKRFYITKKVYAFFSKWAYGQCDRIAVTSKGFVNYLNNNNNIPYDRIDYLPQHAPEDLLKQDLYKDPGDVIEFLFAGNLGQGANLSVLLYSAKKIMEKGVYNFRIKFVGTGSAKEELVRLKNELKLDNNVIFCGPVDMDKMAAVYKEADGLLISLRKGQITVPGKLQAYMATGKPIFGSMDGSGKQMIEEAQCGKCVNADKPNELAECMYDMIVNPKAYRIMGENGKKYFKENFTLDKHIEQLLNLFDQVLNGGNKR